MNEVQQKLFELARQAKQSVYAPTSKFLVGAALVTDNGSYFSGCNVESVTMTLCTHAEMNAIDTMVSAGERKISHILVITDSPTLKFPCALCRQKIREFANPETLATTANSSGQHKTATIGELYPDPFLLDDILQPQ